MSREDFKFFLANHMQLFASKLLATLIDQRRSNQSLAEQAPSLSSSCRDGLLKIASESLQNKRWALKVLDSSGRLQAGLASGSLFNSIGNYEQCNSQRLTKYCLAQLELSSEASQLAELTGLPRTTFTSGRLAKLGLCVPTGCARDELLGLTNFFLRAEFPASRLAALQLDCHESPVWTTLSKLGLAASLLLMLALATCCACATLLDSLDPRKNLLERKLPKLRLLVSSFSLRISYKRLVSPRRRISVGDKSLDLKLLDGLRVLSVLWIMVIHSYNFALEWLMFDNVETAENVYKTLPVQWIANGTFSVDNFFLISGLLSWLRISGAMRRASGATGSAAELEPRETPRRLSLKLVLASLAERYFRLAPLQMLLILFSVTVLPRLATGQQWADSTRMFDEWCRSGWIWNLLMVQNIVRTGSMCFSHSWYMAADFQLGILLLLVSALPGICARLRPGHLLVWLSLLAQLLVFGVTVARGLPSAPLLPGESPGSLRDYYGLLYIKPYYWLASYSAGALLAMLLLSLADKRRKWDRAAGGRQLALQLGSLGLLGSLVAFTLPVFSGSLRLDRLSSGLHAALARPLWSAGLAGLLLSSSGPSPSPLARSLRALLTASLWRPLSRLSYSAYLSHPLLMAAFYGSRTQSFHFSHFLLLHFTIGHICLTYLSSLLLYMLVECPLRLLLASACWPARAPPEAAGAQLEGLQRPR